MIDLLQTLFQFHKGTIKTAHLTTPLSSNKVFQFHKGTIKTMIYVLQDLMQSYFNSIKVRLKRSQKQIR